MTNRSKGAVIDRLLSQNLITEDLIKRADAMQKQSATHMFVGEALIAALRTAIEDGLTREKMDINKVADASRGHCA